nr:MAG TPA: hypothetical protein [Caudoviricetes sp.]
MDYLNFPSTSMLRFLLSQELLYHRNHHILQMANPMLFF